VKKQTVKRCYTSATSINNMNLTNMNKSQMRKALSRRNKEGVMNEAGDSFQKV